MVFDYVREAYALAEEGNTPAHVDAVMKAFGFAMGPFAMSDLSGLDISVNVQKLQGKAAEGRTNVLEQLVERKRLGQKAMAGFFKYDKAVGKGREPIADPEVEELIAQAAFEERRGHRRGAYGLELPPRLVTEPGHDRLPQKIAGSPTGAPNPVSRKSKSQPSLACLICLENIQP